MIRRLVAASVAPIVLTLPAFGQGFVERSTAVGLEHTFTAGLDRLGNLAIMNDWAQVGVGVADLDGDGLQDVVAAGHITPTQVFRNDGGTFTNISGYAGLNSTDFDNAVALGDYDGDGDVDAWLGSVGPLEGPIRGGSRLYDNDGSAAFTDVTARAGTRGNGHSIGGKWFDLDYDGDLDLLVSEFHGTSNCYYVNNGDGTFVERASELGLATSGSTHITAVFDVDNDGYVDVLVGNDWRANVLVGISNNDDDRHLRNDGTGNFIDVTDGARFAHGGPDGSGPGSGTMGITCADVDYDGDLDIYKTEQDTQFLMLNNGWPSGGPWIQVQEAYGVANVETPSATNPANFGPTVGWGCFFFDVDRDRYEDLFKVNGHVGPNSLRDQQNNLFMSGGPAANFTFTDETVAFGLLDNYDDRGLSAADLDRDGDIDLLVAPPGDDLRYFENQVASTGGWLHITADTRTSAPGGNGTVLRWTDADGHPHVRQIGSDSPSASQHETMVYFGLGPETSIDLEATFPSGMVRTYTGVQANQHFVVREPEMIRLSRKTFMADAGPDGLGPHGPFGPNTSGTTVTSANPGDVSLGTTGIAVTPKVGGRRGLGDPLPDFSVTVFAHDQTGQRLDGKAAVSITVPGLLPKGPVQYLGGNVFRREFEIENARPGSYRVQAVFDGFAVRIRPTVNIVGAVSASESDIVVSPEGVRSGTADTFQVAFAPKDSNGLALGPGQEVLIEVEGPGGIALTPMMDVGGGSYSIELPAPSSIGFKFISVTVNGQKLDDIATIDAALTPFALNTLFYREDPHPDIALRTWQLRFVVTPRDVFGLRTGTNVAINLVITPDPGSEPVFERTDVSPVVRPNGDIVFILERDSASAFGTAEGTIEVVVDGQTILTTTYDF